MKSILVLSLLSVILVFGISQAEAYEGKISGTTDESQYIQGDIVTFSGYIIRADPIPDEKVQIIFVERATGSIIFTDETDIDLPSKFEGDDEYWTFEYTLDTENTVLVSETTYDIIIIYDDKTDEFDFDFRAPIQKQMLDASKLFEKSETEALEVKEIPEWVKEIFIFYADGDISDAELITTLQYLISIDIIRV